MTVSLLFCFFLPVGATSRSVQDALNWCASKVGTWYDYDGAYGPQCVDLIYGYYNYLGVTPAGGNGQDYAWNTVPSGWQRIQGAVPQPGDILVYTNSPYGHVAIQGNSVIYHIRPSYSKYVLAESVSYNYYPNYWGVIRPNFSSSSASGGGLTASGVVYPININKGAPDNGYFTISGSVSSSYTIEYAEVQICDSSWNTLYVGGGYESNGARTYYNLHDFDALLSFSKLPVGSYYYVIVARDKKGYHLYAEYPFTVSWSATTKGTSATLNSTHLCTEFGTWDSGKVTTEAGCAKTGTRTYTCKVCGATKTEAIAATGHRYSLLSQTAPSCDKNGIKQYKCANCGRVYAEIVPALGHEYMNGSCIRCGLEQKDFLDDNDSIYDDFSDIWDVGEWAHQSIQLMYHNCIFSGMGNGKFEPNTAMTRGMLVTVLYNRIYTSGSKPQYANPFSDVGSGDWYYDGVTWAAANGIVAGMGDGIFAPNDKLTREQFAAILYRFEVWRDREWGDGKGNGYQTDLNLRTSLSAFPDKARVSAWAEDALSWAVANQLISGSKEGDIVYLNPQSDATRAQAACILDRFKLIY